MTTKATSLIAALLIATWQSLSAQQPIPASDQADRGGIVKGTVRATSGQPLPRTQVTLSGPRRYVATTNPYGEFAITDVATGSYQLLAERPGYLAGAYGGPDSPPAASAASIRVERNQTVERVDLTLTFGAVISGRVLDENGQPFPGGRIEAIPLGPQAPAQRNARAITTDDLGRFRITALRPGGYIVRASEYSTDSWDNLPDDDSVQYAPTYFPGELDRERAQTITLAAEAQADGIDLSIATVPRTRPLVVKPPYANDPRPAAGSTVSGTVAQPDGRPVRHAFVHLTQLGNGSIQSGGRIAATNSQGVFRINRVPPGRYEFMIGNSLGYPLTVPGRRHPDDPHAGFSVEVAEGRDVRDVRLTLAPGAALSGRITDPAGLPVPGVRVTVLEERYIDGRLVRDTSINMATRPVTDALGEFRVKGLVAGRYYVMATSQEWWPGATGDERMTFATTFFPAGPYELAQPIDLRAGDERTVNLTMDVSRTARVEGILLGATGAPTSGVNIKIELAARGSRALGDTSGESGTVNDLVGSTYTGNDGAFAFNNVPPGEYLLTSDRVSEFVTVPPAGAFGVTVVERSGQGAIRGSIATDDGGPPPFDTTNIRMGLLYAPDDRRPVTTVARVERDWSFFVGGIQKPALLRVIGLPDGWTVSAIRRGNEDIVDRPISVSGELDGVRIVLTSKTGEMSGRVETARRTPLADVPVVVFSDDASRWEFGSRYIRTVYTDERGTFTVRGLLPGSYRVVAPQSLVRGQGENADFLRSVERNSQRIAVSAGGSVQGLQLRQSP